MSPINVKMEMQNPWKEIEDNKRVLDCDLSALENHNSKRKSNPIKYTDFPEPFIGNKNSEIYLLLGNPGSSESTNYTKEQVECILKNLRHENVNLEFPHYFLDTKFKNHPGNKWWNNVFKGLRKELNVDFSVISKNIFCIELFGYHSKFGDPKIMQELPSVDYTKYLVKQAIKDKKVLILARGVTKWFKLVPELADYDNCTFLASNRGISLSKSTISPATYNQIRGLLQKASMKKT